MLKLLADKKAKISAQNQFEKNLRAAWEHHELRTVTWRSGNNEPGEAIRDVAHDNNYWFTTVAPNEHQKIFHYWNAIGKYTTSGKLQITVEVNIPTASNSQYIRGFFALDESTGTLHLMHDGRIGGNQKHSGRANFLACSGAKLVPVVDEQGNIRHGIIVTPLESKAIGENVARFLKTVGNFKLAVRNGEIDDNTGATNEKFYKAYFREFSGVKKGQRTKEIEYISRHGDIVHALSGWREKRNQQRSGKERLVKDQYIDLGVFNGMNQLIELYEVKTNAERQTLYTAIGQIIVHRAGNEHIASFIVLPTDLQVPPDVGKALKTMAITVLRFALKDDDVFIMG